MELPLDTTTVEEIMKNRQHQGKSNLLSSNTFTDQRTNICIAHRGVKIEKKKHVCDKCQEVFEYDKIITSGLDPIVVDSWDRIVKPMNQAIYRFFAVGFEVADAYNKAVKSILEHPQLREFPYILFVEDDIIVPLIPNSFGPLLELMRLMDRFDIAGALYWTKGVPSIPLIYGRPGSDNFENLTDWKEGDVVPCNGLGMGFTLMKRSLFEDPRLKDEDGNWFKTVNYEEGGGIKYYTQDLYFMEKATIKHGYKACVHTGIRAGHLDFSTGSIY